MDHINVDDGLREDPDDPNIRYSSIRNAEGRVIGHITVTAIRTFKLEVTLSGNTNSSITATDVNSKSFEAAAFEAASMAVEALGGARNDDGQG